MPHSRLRHAFTWIEFVVILAILGLILGIIIPAVLSARERNRRNDCANNLKLIGLGMHNYNDARKYFPGSAQVVRNKSEVTAGGWSFLFMILPNMEYDSPYSSWDPGSIKGTIANPPTTFPLTSPGVSNAIACARGTQISEIVCPANPNKIHIGTGLQSIAFTNYKAMGASSMESLMLAIDPNSLPPYGNSSQHPDGAIYPTNTGIPSSAISDGLANTIMVAETIDDTASCWLAGCDTTLVGMPMAKNYQQVTTATPSFFAPLDFNGKYYGQATPALQSMRTYLAYDFRPSHADAGVYPAGVGRTPAYGPSSNHPGLINHLFSDGSVHSIRKDIDYAAYFFLITKSNADPVPLPSIYQY